MNRLPLTLLLTFLLTFGLWTLAVVDFAGVSSSFADGETVSASAFNDLFSAIDGNFQTAKAAIEGNQAAIGTLQAFDAALTASACPSGQAVQGVGADGTATCASLGSTATVPAASVTRTADLSVNNNAPTTIAFNTEFFDTADLHSNTVNPSRLSAPEAGIYQVSANVTWLQNASGSRTLTVNVNGSSAARMSDSRTPVNGATSQSVSGLLQLAAGDYVEARVFQDSGSTLTISSTAPLRFEMVKVASVP
jgi:hypothetical protein